MPLDFTLSSLTKVGGPLLGPEYSNIAGFQFKSINVKVDKPLNDGTEEINTSLESGTNKTVRFWEDVVLGFDLENDQTRTMRA